MQSANANAPSRHLCLDAPRPAQLGPGQESVHPPSAGPRTLTPPPAGPRALTRPAHAGDPTRVPLLPALFSFPCPGPLRVAFHGKLRFRARAEGAGRAGVGAGAGAGRGRGGTQTAPTAEPPAPPPPPGPPRSAGRGLQHLPAPRGPASSPDFLPGAAAAAAAAGPGADRAEEQPGGPSMSEVPCKKRDDYLEWPEKQRSKFTVCHAELNAIMNKNSADVKGCTMYVALFPCNECAKLIIQAGIKEVIFMSDKYHDSDEMTAARLLFDMAGVAFRKFTPKCSKIVIDFDSINNMPSQKLQELFRSSE
uniref:dCMP deaminase n=1 Tax=Canis lupus familiaris TaxID=9615 RepID=A0A8C0QAY4_CANLF